MNMNSASSNLRCVADALGLGSLADGEPGMDPDLLRQLYRHARNEDGKRRLFETDASFARGWVNLDGERARELVAAFVPLDDADSLKDARRNAQANLEAQPWNDLLGIDSPPIICKVKIHGAKWGLRFLSAEPAKRGCEVLNEHLPPIATGSDSDDEAVPPKDEIQATLPAACSALNDIGNEVAITDAAADILKRGGLPA